MTERIFNLFYFTQNDVIHELGVVVHELKGTDSEKMAFLQNSITKDFLGSRRFLIPRKYAGLTVDAFFALCRLGKHLEVYEEIFFELNAPFDPLCCVTPIVDGRPKIDVTTDHSPFLFSDHKEHPKFGIGEMSDYLEDYMTPDGFDLPKLMYDDYFSAIHILFNSGHYVSCMKLLVSFIDTLAFLEYGDKNRILWIGSMGTPTCQP
ncbi:hypothetical protein [Candidatus Amarolinea dominans]|uniref:hypothetical protein n=1 Tax=Candidatus Amarolinea dominans TaxID=3140696 RepID=UPI001DEEB9F7|nr:hypothetical protein [Anaerolineae bacterium]